MRILATLALLSCLTIQGAVHYATGLSQPELQASIDSASDGDIVVWPPGRITNAATVVVSNKALEIMGSATNTIYGDGTNSTILVNGVPNNIPLIKIHNLGEKRLWIHHFVLDAALRTTPNDGVLWIGDFGNPSPSTIHSNTSWAISNFTITNGYRGMIYSRAGIGGHSGVIWQGHLLAPNNVSATGLRGFGHTNFWTIHSPLWGSTNKVIMEDMWFDFTYANNGAWDSYRGFMGVIRYSDVWNSSLGGHGTDSGGINLRGGSHSIELYGNRIRTLSGSGAGRVFQYRGGSGLIWGNDISVYPGSQTIVHMDHYRAASTNIYYPKNFPTNMYAPWGFVTGLSNNMATIHPTWLYPTPNRIDGNSNVYGWPALDQIGRSGPTVFGATNTSQPSWPFYIWDNVINGSNLIAQVNTYENDWNGPIAPDLIQRGRDFFDDGTQPSGYTPLSYPHPLRLSLLNVSPPTISAIPDTTVAIGTSSNLDFTVSSADLTYNIESTDTNVLPLTGISISGLGTLKTVSITSEIIGFSQVTIRVTDTNFLNAQETFLITSVIGPVDTAISPIDDQQIVHDTSTGPLDFTIANSMMVLSKLSTNPNLVPDSGIVFGGSGTDRTVTVTPSPGMSGVTTIFIGVSISGQTNGTDFQVVVTPDRIKGPLRPPI